MEKPKLEHKTYKKIVPLKGNLLQKLKNELKKELSKNESAPVENGVNDTINNNIDINQVPTVKSPLKSLDQKIIIQKVENVKIEMITTSPQGSLRRLSDLFTPAPMPGLFSAPKIVNPDTVAMSDANLSEIDENLPTEVENNSVTNGKDVNHASVTLLSTKIAHNSFNQKVPLKMVRTVKPPKPKPNLRNRFHRVETFKTLEPEEPEPEPIDANREVELDHLVPDIEMKDTAEPLAEKVAVNIVEQEAAMVTVTQSLVPSTVQCEDNISERPKDPCSSQEQDTDQETVLHEGILSKGSDLDEDFRGFPAQEENVDKDLMIWFNCLKMGSYDYLPAAPQPAHSTTELELPKVLPEISFFGEPSGVNTVKVELKQPTNQRKRKTIKTPAVVKRALKISKKKKKESQPDLSAVEETPAKMIPSCLESPQKIVDPISEEAQVEPPVEENCPTKPADVVVPATPESPNKVSSFPVPNKDHPRISKGKCEKKGRSDWQNDILVVLGVSRIKEIDEKLKTIPNLVTGNAIETENVELKLIIRHFMRKFKVSSIMDTLTEEQSSSNQAQDSSLDGDYDDDYPDSFDDDSNGPNTFFDPSNEDSFDTSNDDDDDRNSNSFHENVPGVSQAALSTNNEELRVSPTETFDEPDTRVSAKQSSADEKTVNLQVTLNPFDDTKTKTEEKLSLVETTLSTTQITEKETTAVQAKKRKNVSSPPLPQRKKEKTDVLATTTLAEPLSNERCQPVVEHVTSIPLTSMIQEEEPVIDEPVEIEKKVSTRKPWHLLLDGESRRSSLRNSSNDSNADSGKELKDEKKAASGSVKKEKRTSRSGSALKKFAEDDEGERRKSLRSSSRDISAGSSIETNPLELKSERKRKTRPQRPLTIRDEDKKRTSALQNSSFESEEESHVGRRASLRHSSVESGKSTKERRTLEKSKVMSDSDSGPGKRLLRTRKTKRIQPMTDESDDDRTFHKDVSSADSEKPLSNLRRSKATRRGGMKSGENTVKEKSSKIVKKMSSRKIIDSSSDSDEVPLTNNHKITTSRNLELESRLNPLDSNSKRKSSSIFIRNDYLKPTERKSNSVNSSGVSKMLQTLSKVISAKKKNDPTFVEPPLFATRERLRTSASKGNVEECSNDEDVQTDSSEPNTRPSVSRESSVDSAIVQTNSESKSDLYHTSPPRQRRAYTRRTQTSIEPEVKKEFLQQPLKPAIERLVPYDKILEAIITGSNPTRIGRANRKLAQENDVKKEILKEKLQALDYFRCGSCNCDITKHHWTKHFLEHGGIAWIDGFDAPISLNDWSEVLRRTLKSYKIYNTDVMTCPNCRKEKRSVLSHLSHMLICSESEEVVEQRKHTCKLCNEKYFPFNAAIHKHKCSGYQKIIEPDNEAVSEDEDDETTAECLNLSGRTKRKAVKRAERKFKVVLKSLDRPSDHLDVISGQLTCNICGETNFDSKNDAFNHIKNEHDTENNGDFEGESDSDEEVLAGDESSDETEGSSGVESSKMSSSSEEETMVECEDSFEIVSSKKAKPSSCESQEVKYGRALITEYVESLRNQKIASKTMTWTKQFADINWKSEVFPKILPKLNLTLNDEPKALLSSLHFKLKSLKFGVKLAEHYVPTYENVFKKPWKQLEIGENYSCMDSSTIYCGGSVASVDWAPASSEHPNFLAVACNTNNKGIQINLSASFKSCVQVYEFQHLKNKSFEGFQNKTKLSYVIVIDDGPVWSIKFHPSESSGPKRIGLLAVTTGNQRILIFSMPYLSSDNPPSVVSLQPNIICKLQQDDVLFNDEFLLQALKLAWYQKSGHDSVLAAGFISGVVGVWNISRHEYSDDTEPDAEPESNTVYPQHVIQAHFEPVTALDFKTTEGTEFHLLTSSGDRKIKVFTFDELTYQETASYYSTSRVLCTEWWMHWPGYLIGIDDCFTFAQLIYRQPLEFGMRNSNLISVSSPTTHLAINHWMNFAMFVTDSGDVIGCSPRQMLIHTYKERWDKFQFNFYSQTDYNKIVTNEEEEIGVVFGDFKSDSSQPKKFRVSPTERINELQINQVCFNRNEESHRFYALAYETGFVRIRYLKNSK